MAGFNYDQFFTLFKSKMTKAVTCTVGRYTVPKPTQLPYCDLALSDISGGHYDLKGGEGSTSPMLTVTVYAAGSLADNTCEKISAAAKQIMLSFGFQCKTGPMPITNAADTNISRWVARYQRVFAAGDELAQINT